MFIGTHHPSFENLRRSEMFFGDNKSLLFGKTQHVTPTEFKNPHKRFFYKHFTPLKRGSPEALHQPWREHIRLQNSGINERRENFLKFLPVDKARGNVYLVWREFLSLNERNNHVDRR